MELIIAVALAVVVLSMWAANNNHLEENTAALKDINKTLESILKTLASILLTMQRESRK